MINTLNTMMHHRGIGVLYLDDAANVIATNSKAEEMLNTSSRFWCTGKQLCFEDSGVRQTFLGKLKAIKNKNLSACIFIKKSLHMPPIKVSVFPVIDNISNQIGEKSSWLLLVNDTEMQPSFSASSMAQFYDLTNAEVALVSAIYDGLTLGEYAKKRGVKITTVRWTLDNVFSKTYTHSQLKLRELASKFID